MTTEDPSIDDVRALESFVAGAGDSRLLLTFQGILRSHERMFHALSTPPADDVREALAEAERIAQVRLERITQLLDEPTLTPDERDWLIMAARMVRHETEHPTAVKTLKGMRVAVRRTEVTPHKTATSTTKDEVNDALWGVIRNAMNGTHSADSIASAVRFAFEVCPYGTVTDAARMEYTIAAESENGAITQLADYTTVVREHLNADLELYRIEEARAKGNPDRIFIAERPVPKWVRS